MRVLSIALFLLFPTSITIAIARYKLFDIDFLINRTLVYTFTTWGWNTCKAQSFGLLKQNGRMTLEMALPVLNAIADALDYAL